MRLKPRPINEMESRLSAIFLGLWIVSTLIIDLSSIGVVSWGIGWMSVGATWCNAILWSLTPLFLRYYYTRDDFAAARVPIEVSFTADTLRVLLVDRREVKMPLVHYPALANASHDERNSFKMKRKTIYWPQIDLEIVVHDLLFSEYATIERRVDSVRRRRIRFE